MDIISLRLLTKEDIPMAEWLFEKCFKVAPKPEFMQWKYFDNPSGMALLGGAFHESQLVCFGALIPEQMSVFGEVVKTYKFTDLMTHPDHQRKGLSKKTTLFVVDAAKQLNPAFFYTICSKVSTKSFIRNDWSHVEEFVNYFLPKQFIKINLLFRKSHFQNIKHFDSVSNQLNDFSFKVNSESIHLVKTIDVLKWKTSNPNFDYKLICSYDQNYEINGFLIYSLSTSNIMTIIDFETSNGDKKTISNLLDFTKKIVAQNHYKGLVFITMKKSPMASWAKKQGFLINPFKFGPLKTILDFNVLSDEKAIKSPKNWEVNSLAYDDV